MGGGRGRPAGAKPPAAPAPAPAPALPTPPVARPSPAAAPAPAPESRAGCVTAAQLLAADPNTTVTSRLAQVGCSQAPGLLSCSARWGAGARGTRCLHQCRLTAGSGARAAAFNPPALVPPPPPPPPPTPHTHPRRRQAAGLDPYLSDPRQPFMLFAPDDIAWAAFFEGEGETTPACPAAKLAAACLCAPCWEARRRRPVAPLPLGPFLPRRLGLCPTALTMRSLHPLLRHGRPPAAGFKTSEAQLAADQELLRALLRYHVVPDEVVPEAQVRLGLFERWPARTRDLRAAAPLASLRLALPPGSTLRGGGLVAGTRLPSLALPPRLAMHPAPRAPCPRPAASPHQWAASTTFPSLAPAQFLGVRLPAGTDDNYYIEGAPVRRLQ